MIKIRIMGKLKFFGLLIAAGMFAACSDNLENGGTGNEGATIDKGYIRVALNLPTTSGSNSRISNDDFDDGVADEYEVKNAILVLFTGGNESEATYSQAFDITPSFQSQPSDNVTTRYTTQSIEINKPNTGNVYGLVILNHNDLFKVESDELKWKASGSSDFTTFSGNLSALNNTSYTISDISAITTTGGFLMTNAPKAKLAGSATDLSTNQDVTTLVQLTVRASEADANAYAPDEIYVERVVAKTTVKVNVNDGNNTLTVNGGDYDGASVKFEGWKLNTTNKVTYLVRNVSDWNTWKGYSSEGSNRFFGTDSKFYRVYWAKDPNYNATDATNLSTYAADDYETIVWNDIDNNTTVDGSEHPQYCLENTTNLAHMLEPELTGVLFKTTFTPKDAGANPNFFMVANKSEIYTQTNFLNLVNTILGAGTVTTINGEGGTYTAKGEVATLLGISEDNAEKLLADSRIGGDIKFYKGGVTYYYSTFIKHFGDDLTPYTSGTTYEDAKHLGRYGVVRNNWYELSVNSVKGIGYPNIPVPDPDEGQNPDEEESWIRCSINVLSWAKRSQGVDLQ